MVMTDKEDRGMAQKGSTETAKHSILIDQRSRAVIEGVTDVLRFDENEVVVNTLQGALVVEGEGLHVSALSLDAGKIELDGKIDGLLYEDKNEKKGRGFFARLTH